jgi:hypothetical protein
MEQGWLSWYSNKAIDWLTEESGFKFLAVAGDVSHLCGVLTSSGTHPASYPVGTSSSFFGFKATGA